MRKSLSLLLAIAMVFSMFSSLAFAADADLTAQQKYDALAAKGIFAGINGEAALDQNMNRAQFARVASLILGLEDISATDTNIVTEKPFSDVELGLWYTDEIAAAKEAGVFVGNADGTFNPKGDITIQELAVVAAGLLGLEKVEDTTVEGAADWAAGYIQALINAGVDFPTNYTEPATRADLASLSFQADAAINPEVPVGVLAVDSVTAKTNSKVDVAVKEALTSVDAASFAIKDAAGAAFAVTSATLSADGKTVHIVTGAQVPGALYTLTAAGATFEFVGLVKDETKPAITSAVALTNTTVKVIFDNDDLDGASALVAANYVVADLEVTAAAFDVDADGKDVTNTVILTTASQTSGKLYEAKVSNVADLSGNVITASSAVKFGGKAKDTTKPAVSTVVSKKGNSIEVTFTETEVLSDNAIDIANYAVDNDITVTGASFKKGTNKVTGVPVVVLTTSDQVNGKLYKLSVKNISDVAGNIIDSKDISFGGTPLDTVKIGIDTATAETNTTIVVGLDDSVDATTVLAENFTFDKGLTTVSATVDADDDTKVNLVTSAQEAGLYTLTIANLKDKAGNAVNSDKKEKKFGGKAADTAKPEISSVIATDRNTVKVTFNEKVDKATAQTLSSYVFDGSLGYPTKATLDAGKTIVTLKTVNQASQVYKVKVSNVKDLSGNVITASTEKSFAGVGEAVAKVKLDAAYAIDKQTIKLLFNQAVDAGEAVDTTNYTIKSATNSGTNIGTITGATVATTAPTAVATLGGDDKEVTITFPSSHSMVGSEIYNIAINSALIGKYGAIVDTDNDDEDFSGIDSAKADLKVDLVNVIDKNTVELVFNANISGTVDASKIAFLTAEGDITGSTTTNALAVGSAATIDKNKLTVTGLETLASVAYDLVDSTVYYVQLAAANGIKDVSGLYDAKVDNADDKSEAVFATGTIGATELKVDVAIMTDENTLDIYFNRDIDTTTGTFAPQSDIIIKKGSTTVVSTTEFQTAFKTDGKKLTVYLVNASSDFANGDVLTVEFSDLNSVVYKNNTAVKIKSDAYKVDFAAVDTDNAAPSLSVAAAVYDTKVKVTLSEGLASLSAGDLKVRNVATDTSVTFTIDAYTAGDKDFIITVTGGGKFLAGVTYEIAVVDGSTVKEYSGIETIKKSTGAANWDNSVRFTGTAQ